MLRYKGKFIKKKQLDKVINSTQLIGAVNKDQAASKAVNSTDNKVKNDTSFTWSDGRRVVDLDQLAKGLNNCKSCMHTLNLLDTVKEVREGLGSVLHIKCDVCSTVNEVTTGKKHGEGGRGVFDVNSKAAVGKCQHV